MSRGDPRTPYERTYVLLPPGADSSWALAVVEATWDKHRYTFGGSADDAGIGDLDIRRVIAINPHLWNGDLVAFYEKHYPEIELIPIVAGTPAALRKMLQPDTSGLLLNQCNPIWANERLAGVGCNKTICQAGCFNTNLAMAQRYYGIDPKATPSTVNAALGPSGYNVCDVRWSEVEKKLGLKVLKKTSSSAEANAHLDKGEVCFAEVLPTSLLHFVLVTHRGGGRYWMYDSWKNFEGWLDEKYSGVESWRLIQGPSAPPTSPSRGLHDLPGADWLQSQGLKGWCIEPVYLGLEPKTYNLSKYTNVKVLLNLRFSYAVDDGGQGTMPGPGQLAAFESACVQTMQRNPQAAGFIYCNEMNNSREWPKDFNLTPDYYLKSYNSVWLQSPQAAVLMPGAIDPYNAGWGDWRVTWKYVLENILGCSGLAFHTYTHGRSFEPNAVFEHAPLKGVYYNLRVLESQQAIVPVKHRGKQQLVTETNHWVKDNGEVGWEPDAAQWVADAYRYFASRGIIGACLFRYNFDQWRISDKPKILEALRATP